MCCTRKMTSPYWQPRHRSGPAIPAPGTSRLTRPHPQTTTTDIHVAFTNTTISVSLSPISTHSQCLPGCSSLAQAPSVLSTARVSLSPQTSSSPPCAGQITRQSNPTASKSRRHSTKTIHSSLNIPSQVRRRPRRPLSDGTNCLSLPKLCRISEMTAPFSKVLSETTQLSC